LDDSAFIDRLNGYVVKKKIIDTVNRQSDDAEILGFYSNIKKIIPSIIAYNKELLIQLILFDMKTYNEIRSLLSLGNSKSSALQIKRTLSSITDTNTKNTLNEILKEIVDQYRQLYETYQKSAIACIETNKNDFTQIDSAKDVNDVLLEIINTKCQLKDVLPDFNIALKEFSKKIEPFTKEGTILQPLPALPENASVQDVTDYIEKISISKESTPIVKSPLSKPNKPPSNGTVPPSTVIEPQAKSVAKSVARSAKGSAEGILPDIPPKEVINQDAVVTKEDEKTQPNLTDNSSGYNPSASKKDANFKPAEYQRKPSPEKTKLDGMTPSKFADLPPAFPDFNKAFKDDTLNRFFEICETYGIETDSTETDLQRRFISMVSQSFKHVDIVTELGISYVNSDSKIDDDKVVNKRIVVCNLLSDQDVKTPISVSFQESDGYASDFEPDEDLRNEQVSVSESDEEVD
jgi:hypothetical protein